MTKLEKHRNINIGLINELAILCNREYRPLEVIEAAKTKPFGFTAFYPGLGRALHPLDPYYLTGKPANTASTPR